jgi:replication factor A1
MSSSIEEIYQKLLDSGIPKEQLEREIQKKVQEYSGFLSKQGILFLIARELGIEIRDPEIDSVFYEELEKDIDYNEFTIPIVKVKDGMVNIVLLGKVISTFPQREFTRKDGSQGMVGSFVIGDETGKIKVVLWDEKTLALKSSILKDEVVRVISDYAKANKDGQIEVHISKKGKLILAPEDINSKTKQKLKSIEPLETHFEKKSPQASFSIRYVMERYKLIKNVQGTVHIEDFKEITKKNGEKTFLLKFTLSDDSGSVMVNIWGISAVNILKNIEEGCSVRVRNVATKDNDYTKQKEFYFTKTSSLEII